MLFSFNRFYSSLSLSKRTILPDILIFTNLSESKPFAERDQNINSVNFRMFLEIYRIVIKSTADTMTCKRLTKGGRKSEEVRIVVVCHDFRLWPDCM